MMARKQIKISGRMLFTWFMLAGCIFLLAPQERTNKFQLVFASVFRWPLSIGRSFSLSRRVEKPLTGDFKRKELQYQNHIADLVAQLRQKDQEIEILSGLRSRGIWQGSKFVVAYVTTTSIDGLQNKLTINHGHENGLSKGQFVLGDNSVIGTISDVSANSANVRLVTDPQSRIAVRIGGLDVDRLLQGNGNNCAKVKWLMTKHKVKTGDIVYANRKGGHLRTPMIIGKVSRCRRDEQDPSLWDITVKPVCDIERLNNVAVVIMNPEK